MASKTGILHPDGIKTRIVDGPLPNVNRQVQWIGIRNTTDFPIHLSVFLQQRVEDATLAQAEYFPLYEETVASGETWEYPRPDDVTAGGGVIVLNSPLMALYAAIASGEGEAASYFASALDG